MDRRRGQVTHVGGPLEAVASKSSSGGKTVQSTNQQFLTQKVSHASSSDPTRGYNNSTYRGFQADEYPPAGVGRPAKTPSTGSSTQSIIDSITDMGHPRTAQDFRRATKAAKMLSSQDDPIEGIPYYERDRYYTAPGMSGHQDYKQIEDEREAPMKKAAAAWEKAPKGNNKNRDPNLSGPAAKLLPEARDASLR